MEHHTRSKTVTLAEAALTPDQIIRPVALRIMSMRPTYLETSAWLEHIPFAFWLIEAHRPRQVVELGTHHGTSYFAFCQAVERLGLDTRCFAVDTWKGDEHAGFYGEEIYEKVRDFNDAQYSSFSRLVRSTFENALRHFSDGTIDLLHIDGLHTLDAVRHDFETWLPKLSTRGVVVMHDTNVRERDFGVFKLFEELREQYPYFEFVHGHGLGVLGVGDEQNDQLKRLFEAQREGPARRTIHDLFSRLGRGCADASIAARRQTNYRDLQKTVAGQKSKIEGLQKRLEESKGKLEGRARELAEARATLEKQTEQQATEAGRLSERAELFQARGAELGEEIKVLRAQIAEAEAELKQTVGDLERHGRRDEERERRCAELESANRQLAAQLEDAQTQLAVSTETLEDGRRRDEERESQLAELESRLGELDQERDKLLSRLDESNSTLKERTSVLEQRRQSDDEQGRRLAELERERDRLQLENGKLTRNVQTRFDELAKLSRMLLEAEEGSAALKEQLARGAGQAERLLAEIARLDRGLFDLSTQRTAEDQPHAHELDVRAVTDEPTLFDLPAKGDDAIVALTLFADVTYRLATAAHLSAVAVDANGDVLDGVRWAADVELVPPAPSTRRFMGRYRKSQPPSKPAPQNSCVLPASRNGEAFSARLLLPKGAARLRLACRRVATEFKLMLIFGDALLVDRAVTPGRKLEILFAVRGERSLKRALIAVPEFVDATGRVLPAPYDGCRSNETVPAFKALGSAEAGRRGKLRLTVPAGAARLCLGARPALARGKLTVEEVVKKGREPAESILTLVETPVRGAVKVSLTLYGPREEPRAALLVPTFLASNGRSISGPCQDFESSDQYPAFRYLPAASVPTRTDLEFAVPRGTARCKLDVVPCNLRFGLRAEGGSVAVETAHVDGAMLPADGVTLERKVSAGATLWFKLRVTGARETETAGVCAVSYLDAAGNALPPPYPGIEASGEYGAVVPFAASRRSKGRVTAFRLPVLQGAVKARLCFIPNDPDDALRIRIEPMPRQRSIVKQAG